MFVNGISIVPTDKFDHDSICFNTTVCACDTGIRVFEYALPNTWGPKQNGHHPVHGMLILIIWLETAAFVLRIYSRLFICIQLKVSYLFFLDEG